MVTVSGYSEDDIVALGDQFAIIIQESLDRALARTVDGLQPAVTAASSAGLSPDDVSTFTAYWQHEIDTVLTPFVGDVYRGSAVSVAVGLADGFPTKELAGVPLVADEFQVDFMKQVGGSFIGVGDDAAEDIRTVLVDGVRNGESVEQIAAKMQHVSTATQSQALRVARTAVHSSAEAGSIAQLRFVGYENDEVEKEWLASHDGRTRPTHVFADKQKVPLNGKFTVGATSLDYPGDPLGAYAEIVRCRCTALFNIGKDDPPKMRCSGTTVADIAAAQHAKVEQKFAEVHEAFEQLGFPPITAAATTATQCVMPTPKADTSHIPWSVQESIIKSFNSTKVTPTYGGAAIYKAILKVREDSHTGKHGFTQPLADDVDDWMILQVLDNGYAGKSQFTYSEKINQWLQTAAGQKAIAKTGFKQAHTHAVTPITPPAPGPQVVPSLPPIAAKPNPADMVWTGKTMAGATGARVYVDQATGLKWLFKAPQGGSYSAKFLLDIEVAVARIQSRAFKTRPAIYEIKLDGKNGTIQQMFDAEDAWKKGSDFDPLKLSPEDLLTMQQEQIFDWMISNFDTHTGQYLRLPSGALLGIDKGQAFKFFGKDKLDWDYVPVYPLQPNGLTYQLMWREYVQGHDIDLQDPTTGALGEYIDRLMAIPDDEYRKLLTPYALGRQQEFGHDATKFLDAAVARKNSLRADWEDYWKRATAERAKHAPKPAPVVPQAPPTPVVTTPATPPPPTVLIPAQTSISQFDYFVKQDLLEMAQAVNGGKKITPSYGGAKIWKVLKDVEDGYTQSWIDAGAGGLPPNHLQIIRMLDEAGGFKGKPKTLESVLLDWLESPAGKKTVPLPPPSLVKGALPKPVPVVSPAALQSGKTLTDALARTDNKIGIHILFNDLPKYVDDETVAYLEMPGKHLRVVRQDKDVVEVHLSFDNGLTWTLDDSFDDWVVMLAHYKLKSGDKFSQVPSKTATTATKIKGKAPGDTVTMQEVWDARYLYADGDIISEATTFTGQWRLVSDGKGGIQLWKMDTDGVTWVKNPYLVDLDVSSTAKQFDAYGFKLTGTVLDSKKPSVLLQLNAGDQVLPDAIWNGVPPTAKTGQTLAYAYNAAATEELKLTYANGQIIIHSRQAGTHTWKIESMYDNPASLNWHTKQYTWYAAETNGAPPVQYTALVPKPTGGVGITKMGLTSGTEVNPAGIEAFTNQYFDYEVIAFGHSPAGAEYRIYTLSGKVVVEHKPSGGTWQALAVIDDTPGNIQTKLPTAKWILAHPGTVVDPGELGAQTAKAIIIQQAKTPVKAAKAAKKAAPAAPPKPTLTGTQTHIPGKQTGDTITADEIIANWQKYDDGTIIGTLTTKGWDPLTFRLVVVDGKLVLQKQTKAGSWTSQKIVTHKYEIPKQYVSTPVWEAANGQMTKPHLTAVKKFVQKKTQPYTVVPSAAKKAAPAKSYPVQPFVLQPVDTTPWNDVEQEEIFQFFRGKGIKVSSSEQSIWAATQAIKSHFQIKYGGKYLNLNESEILRIVDHRSALRKGVVDTHPFEAKITTWMQTPAGKAWVNKRIDAPIAATDLPAPMSRIADPLDTPIDQQVYSNVTNAEARADRTASHNRYGTWGPGEREATKQYTGSAYTTWNDAIRRGELGTYRGKIKKMQAAMRPSTRPMILHRKTGWPEFNDPSITDYDSLVPYVGRTYITRGFSSMSTGNGSGWSGSVHLIVEAPIGTPMNHVADYSHHPSENETTLAAHLIYEILSVKKLGGSSHNVEVRVRVIGVATP